MSKNQNSTPPEAASEQSPAAPVPTTAAELAAGAASAAQTDADAERAQRKAVDDKERRIEAQRQAKLEEQAAAKIAQLEADAARAAVLEGELERAKAELEVERAGRVAAEAAVRRLTASLSTDDKQVIAGLPKHAAQLRSSVTVPGPSGQRIHAQSGDVLAFGVNDKQLRELQSHVGAVARVHAVPVAVRDELATAGHLRG